MGGDLKARKTNLIHDKWGSVRTVTSKTYISFDRARISTKVTSQLFHETLTESLRLILFYKEV